ncbi:MAG TPA: hypothetical protein DEF39_10025 [Hungateiclostridium thermocellum]|mgnify:CR=1 FL=1|jgi:uncharacterized membrane protein YkvI|uniref:Uncharacterized membrane protein n=2 Tax=Acetivibrio thermocellus TaxID=1515 RepID=A3DD49_ACET2|nr:hypothetical protein [Acetivibrio thermocellus]CDG35336.1 hypothetical protein CTHBC1_0672 [Acetivibrio thermocellus BC1]ABN51878.1 uncharacterized membrane protein [Acetivibrio thermocellus ATCC 27405]ADU74644.1 uncharacterized membrane protein [Acetivibrio thermocellus DSM 1313]ALX08587.1 hypothetical protein AD2_01594 [Acetivibrio thermocellus AD2]ANV76336.1 membrane protein [Acetivibrio thermocellus DSM 2360]
MENSRVSTFKVAATYIGTVVGAGFASGQEMLQFFAVFGLKGFWGLIVVTALFIVFGYIVMEVGRNLQSESHLQIIKHSGGKFLGPLMDWLITFFLFGALTAMIAGSGALVKQQFGINPFWGNLFMAAFTALTVLTGINGVINSISVVVPFLVTSAVGISLASILLMPLRTNPYELVAAAESVSRNGLIGNWLWAAVLYVSYNLVLAISVLGPLGVQAKNKNAIRNGAILGGIGLGVSATAIYFAMERNFEIVRDMEIPMIYLAGSLSYILQIVYALVLIGEIYTTAVGSLYGFSARITDINEGKAKFYIIGATLLALAASQLGFSNMVKYLYPVVGYGGVVLLACLAVTRFKLAKRA